MIDYMFAEYQLNDLIEATQQIAGEWNGDEPGTQEDQAHLANDIIEKATELRDLIKEMKEYL